MPPPSAFARNLAVFLLSASRCSAEPHISEAVVVSERLRTLLTRFAGAEGFESLQRRAWVLASAEVPPLREVTIGTGGHVQGWEEFVARRKAQAEAVDAEPVDHDAAIALTAHLLELMVTFIGRPLTLRLVGQGWPDTSVNQWQSITEADQ